MSASTARLIARCRALAGMPPRLIVTTCAPSRIAQSIARATVICLTRTTLSIARIGISRALGAEPVTTWLASDTRTLAVPVPCPGLPSSVIGSVGSLSSSMTSKPGTNATPTSSTCGVIPVSGWATTTSSPRLGRPACSEKTQAAGTCIRSMAQAGVGSSAASGSTQQPGGKPDKAPPLTSTA